VLSCPVFAPVTSLQAEVAGLTLARLYLPNGNPAPGRKFDYKLRWFERIILHAAELMASGRPVVLAGDYNVSPSGRDVYKPERWVDDALFRQDPRSVRTAEVPGLDRRAAHAASARDDLHLLGLLSQRVPTRCRAANRPLPGEPAARAAAARRGGRRRRARLGKVQRPCARVDRTGLTAKGGARPSDPLGRRPVPHPVGSWLGRFFDRRIDNSPRLERGVQGCGDRGVTAQ
jgi:hypothetical protein